VLMVVLAHHGMLQISHNAGGGGLGEHGNSLSDLMLPTRPPAHVQGDAGAARMACTHR
jgi:hypothetical protein